MKSLILKRDVYQQSSAAKATNSFGYIIGDVVFIHEYDTLTIIKIKNITKAFFHERRNYFINFACSTLALICALAIILNETTIFWFIALELFGVIAIILSFTLKSIEYTFVVTKTNLSFTKIKVDSNKKEDAEELVKKINKKLKREYSLTE